MTALIIFGVVAYFWLAVCIGTMQLERYTGRNGRANEGDVFSSVWAGAFWPITVLVWTAKGVGRWWTE